MIRNISYNNPVINREISLVVGKPFSFWTSFKMGGTGSQKFIITSASPQIQTLLDRENTTNYSNVELRPNGIVVGFKSYTETFGLIIPFSKLKTEVSTGRLTIETDGFFVNLKTLNGEQIDIDFLRKIKAI